MGRHRCRSTPQMVKATRLGYFIQATRFSGSIHIIIQAQPCPLPDIAQSLSYVPSLDIPLDFALQDYVFQYVIREHCM